MFTIAFGVERGGRGSAEQLEALLEESAKSADDSTGLDNRTSFRVFVDTGRSDEFLVVARFPEEELNRVTRANWPFVIRAVIGAMKQVRAGGQQITGVFVGEEKTVEEALKDWNLQHGQFSKMSLD
jgi:hypothetical protein